jgi:hypothetical protein
MTIGGRFPKSSEGRSEKGVSIITKPGYYAHRDGGEGKEERNHR